MLELETADDLLAFAGKKIGTSAWLEITQERIDAFAQATEDFQWIHVDPERCAEELGRPTIAHGYLTLSLLPRLSKDIVSIRNRKSALNYGVDRVRFLAPVECGARVRLHQSVSNVSRQENGVRVVWENEVETEGGVKPALVASTINLILA